MVTPKERYLNVGAIEALAEFLQGIVKLAVSGQLDMTVVNTDAERSVTFALPDPLNVEIVAPVDDVGGGVHVISNSHKEIHEGNHYFYHDTATVGSAGVKYYLFTAPDSATRIHFFHSVAFTAITTVELFEGCDRTGTNLQTAFNNDRNSANTHDLIIHEAVSGGSTDGIKMQPFKGGIATGAAAKAGGEDREDEEIIFEQGVKYLLKITSGTNGNEISTKIHWYEES